jgi:hypothetical protein
MSMRVRGSILVIVGSFLFVCQLHAQIRYEGLFHFQYEEATGKVLLKIDKLNDPFILVNAYGTGIGSNDMGLDRGKLIDTRVVHFEKQGDRILLIQPNLQYRAISDNPLEVLAVKEAFAFSVLYGAKIEKMDGSSYIIDLAPYLLDDNNGFIQSVKESKQGTLKVDKSRSAIYFENTHAFPDNCEFESILTFTGEVTGTHLRSVSPTPEATSIRQHISFIRLPKPGYKPREFHPESGYFDLSYYDYATPIESPLEKKYIYRHRLDKKDPSMAVSDPVKPIIYYIDPGCPEPIKSALVNGGKWWSKAFEAAGFSNAFDVRELPTGAHPLDVRYNMIQWVHRSTRGWSYGSNINDPRTGEILKGHVSLGSLRVRQDYLIAQGLLSPFDDEKTANEVLTKMSLNRLMQLSAHEIGHTIGLAHNFAASVNNRASVMDYPHPYITLEADSTLNFSKAYDDKIGEWDKRAIMYGYKTFDSTAEEKAGLQKILRENIDQGFFYLTDEDGRGSHTASPITHLWDNGENSIAELERLIILRKFCIGRFGLNSIPRGTPLSELEKVFVPLYYMHRYQAEAVSKLVGGYDYTYGVKGLPRANPQRPISKSIQTNATNVLLKLMSSNYLEIPASLQALFIPPAQAYPRSRESFMTNSAPAFDSYTVYESACQNLIDLLMQPERLNRLLNQNLLKNHLQTIQSYLFENRTDKIANIAERIYVSKLMLLNHSENTNHSIKVVLNELIQSYRNSAAKYEHKQTDIIAHNS